VVLAGQREGPIALLVLFLGLMHVLLPLINHNWGLATGTVPPACWASVVVSGSALPAPVMPR